LIAALPKLPLFLAAAATVIATPGPGVMLTITNAARFGARRSFAGILGISLGGALMATVSATGVGLLLATSPRAFTALQYAGAAYLIWLGVKLWRSAPRAAEPGTVAEPSAGERRFMEALALQVTNPQAIVFFVAVFPQFVDPEAARIPQFMALIACWALLVVAIHSAYALAASRAAGLLNRPGARGMLQRAGGMAFMAFGVALAV
jgi:threonine/homoserine/homoserine lactone efflux protein